MRLVSWNICHGGGKRAPQIIRQLAEWNPNVVGLSEFRGLNPVRILHPPSGKWGFSINSRPPPRLGRTGTGCVLASRHPLELTSSTVLPHLGRWIRVKLLEPIPLSLVLVYVPNRSSGIKYDFHRAVVDELGKFAGGPGLAMGDTNTGMPGLDEEVPFFNKLEGQWFNQLADAGWTDLWRRRNPQERVYSWHASNGGAGFRLDQVFGTDMVHQYVQNVRYDWGTPSVGKLRGPSDHAAIIIDLGDF